MKKLTCKELDGVCDTEITGETPEEMGENAANHAMSVNDEAHQAKMKEMGEMQKDPEVVKKWMDDFRSKFDSLPDA